MLPGVVASLLGGTAHAEISVDLRADAAGIQLGTGGTRTHGTNRLPARDSGWTASALSCWTTGRPTRRWE